VASNRARLKAHSPSPLILFGSEATQAVLVDLLRNGPAPVPAASSIRRLLTTGLIAASGSRNHLTIAINDRHPAIAQLVKVLAELGGFPAPSSEPFSNRIAAPEISSRRPLGHSFDFSFRVLAVINQSGGGLTLQEVGQRIVLREGERLSKPVARLVMNGVLVEGDGSRFSFADDVPAAYRELVEELGRYLAAKDPRIAQAIEPDISESASLLDTSGGALRLFGPASRLRNLMALAKHGPLEAADLQWITGNSSSVAESEVTAPFGRGDLVRAWNLPKGRAVALDPTYPAASELKALLLKLEASFPLPNRSRLRPIPDLPPLEIWDGVKLELFGSPIRTSILMSIGVLGWTFEALCVTTAVGYHRENVKASLASLEEEGILGSSRKRRPGFNVRAVTIAETFPAREELMALLRVVVALWPGFSGSVNTALDRLSPRTKEHLRRRKLQERDNSGPHEAGANLASLQLEKRKAKVLADYHTLAQELGYLPNTADLQHDSRLLHQIRANWGKFSSFCEANGIESLRERNVTCKVTQSKESRPRLKSVRSDIDVAIAAEMQRDCVHRYRQLMKLNGKALTSNDLNLKDSNLYRSIRAAFGTYANFRRLAQFPNEAVGRYSRPGPHLRQRCIRQYAELTSQLGMPPNAADLQLEKATLYSDIRLQWRSFAEFCIDIGVTPTGHARHFVTKDAIWRQRCVDEFANLTIKLGFPPTSRQLQDHSNGLYKRILRIWGGFAAFRAEIGVPAVTRGVYNANKRREGLHKTSSI
jgi:hypothetical protein